MGNKIIYEFKNIILRYSCLLIGTIIFINIFIKNNDSDSNCSFQNYNIITILIPMIITIITIGLTLPSEKTYNILNSAFRRLCYPYIFRFTEMILISIYIFALYFIALINAHQKAIYCVDILSIVYSVIFIVLEIPLITKNNFFIFFYLKKKIAITLKEESNLRKIYTVLNETDLDKVLEYSVLTNGLPYTYKHLKLYYKNINENIILIDKLLDINEFYFFKKNGESFVSDINLYNALNTSFKNIYDILGFNSNFDIILRHKDIYNAVQTSKIFISMMKVINKNNLAKEYDDRILFVFEMLFQKEKCQIDKKFKYNFITISLVRTLSEDDIWFLQYLLKVGKRKINENYFDYLFFLAIYLFYILELERISKELENNLKSNQINEFKKFFKDLYLRISIDEIIKLLPNLLEIYDVNPYKFFLYDRRIRNLLEEQYTFDHRLIILCWFKLIISKNAHINKPQELMNILECLSEEDKSYLSELIQNELIKNTEDKNLDILKYTFLKFYNIDEHFDDKFPIVQELKKWLLKNKNLKFNSINFIGISKLKEMIEESFKKAIENYEFYNSKIETKIMTERNLLLMIDYRNEKILNSKLEKSFLNIFDQIILNHFNNEIKVTSSKEITIDQKFLEKFNVKSRNYGDLFKLSISYELKHMIYNFKDSNLFLNNLTLRGEKAILFNIKLNDLSIRGLDFNMIDQIIKVDFPLIDGYYEYFDRDTGEYFYLTKEKTLDKIKKTYFMLTLTYSYNCKIDKDKIVSIKV